MRKTFHASIHERKSATTRFGVFFFCGRRTTGGVCGMWATIMLSVKERRWSKLIYLPFQILLMIRWGGGGAHDTNGDSPLAHVKSVWLDL